MRDAIASIKVSTSLSKTVAGSAAAMRKVPAALMPPGAKSAASQSAAPKPRKDTKLNPNEVYRGTKLHRDDIFKGTKLHRDDIFKGTKLHREYMGRGTQLHRDDIDQGTNLNRDDIEIGTKLNRDDIEHGTMLFRDAPRTMAPPGTKSIFLNPHDISMASRQTQIDTLPPEERDEQEEWAQELIRRSGACPQGYDWNRMPGGYQCKGGGHGITDDMLEEGKGGMWALPTKKWDEKVGPYYPRNGEFFKVKPQDLEA